MSNITMASVKSQPRTELHDLLNLTSCEISINELAPNQAVPFVHAHKENEETYIVLGGNGLLYIDGEIKPIKRDDVFRIAPAGKRCIKAGMDGLKIMCVQAKANSLEQFTFDDGIRYDEKAFAED